MTDTPVDELELEMPDELTVLKERATLMGISFHPSIGVEKLREKLNARLTNQADPDESQEVKVVEFAESPERARRRRKDEAARLVRISLTCMNPAKREWPGEVITASNAAVGTFKKYVPFDGAPYHVPHIIYEQLRDRMCQVFYTEILRGGPNNGLKTRRGKLIREFAIEVLPPLTEKEIAELARQQALAGGVGE